MNIRITQISDGAMKSSFTEKVLRRLPKWFGIESSLGDYVVAVHDLPFWAALEGENCVGIVAGKIHHGHTGDIYVLGNLPEYHGQGIGRQLMAAAEDYFTQNGCKYVIVKTLSELAKSEEYEMTRKFYLKVGYQPLITLAEMWDENNPCLIMIKVLRQ